MTYCARCCEWFPGPPHFTADGENALCGECHRIVLGAGESYLFLSKEGGGIEATISKTHSSNGEASPRHVEEGP